MARKKQYIEEEVIEKAMHLFWRNGYEATSVRMLEKEMGINQFSMYSSFGSKHGVFLESLKCYKGKINTIFKKLKESDKGVDGIKEFFYNSLSFSTEMGGHKGCLVTNTSNEFAQQEDELISNQMNEVMSTLKEIFIEKLKTDSSKDAETILKQANYLVIAKQGLAVASKIFSDKELEDYIELTFKNV